MKKNRRKAEEVNISSLRKSTTYKTKQFFFIFVLPKVTKLADHLGLAPFCHNFMNNLGCILSWLWRPISAIVMEWSQHVARPPAYLCKNMGNMLFPHKSRLSGYSKLLQACFSELTITYSSDASHCIPWDSAWTDMHVCTHTHRPIHNWFGAQSNQRRIRAERVRGHVRKRREWRRRNKGKKRLRELKGGRVAICLSTNTCVSVHHAKKSNYAESAELCSPEESTKKAKGGAERDTLGFNTDFIQFALTHNFANKIHFW